MGRPPHNAQDPPRTNSLRSCSILILPAPSRGWVSVTTTLTGGRGKKKPAAKKSKGKKPAGKKTDVAPADGSEPLQEISPHDAAQATTTGNALGLDLPEIKECFDPPPFDPPPFDTVPQDEPTPAEKATPAKPTKDDARIAFTIVLNSDTLEELLRRFNEFRDPGLGYRALLNKKEWAKSVNLVQDCYKSLTTADSDADVMYDLVAVISGERNVAK